MLLHRLDGIVHLLMGLPYRQAADGIAGKVQVRDALHMVDADIVENGALIDAEEHLAGIDRVFLRIVRGEGGLAALQPANGAVAGALDIIPRRGDLDALFKGHGDIGAQVGLDAHALLRAHEDMAPVDMGIEFDALLRDFTKGRQGEDLKAAAVGEDRSIPGHKAVQPAELFDERVPRADMEMIGIGKLHLTADLFQIPGGESAFDGPLGSDVHKNGGLHKTVGRLKLAAAGAAFLFKKRKHWLPRRNYYLSFVL